MVKVKLDKKGIELKNFLGIVLALLGLLLILYAVSKIYAVTLDQDAENAKNTLDLIMAKVEALPEGESNSFAFQGFRGADIWYLVGWNKEDSLKIKPEKCFDTSCICVCKGPTNDNCQEKGFCREVSQEKINVFTEPFSYSESVAAGTGAPGVMVTKTLNKQCIPLSKNLFGLKIQKELNGLDISSSKDEKISNSVFSDCKDI